MCAIGTHHSVFLKAESIEAASWSAVGTQTRYSGGFGQKNYIPIFLIGLYEANQVRNDRKL